MTLMRTFNCNTIRLFAKSATRLFCNNLKSTVTWRTCGIMARQELANLCVLVLDSPHCFLRHSIIGGMATKERTPSSSRSGKLGVQSSWGITSKSGQTDIRSSLRSKDPLCRPKDPRESSSHQTTLYRNVSEETQHCWLHSKEDSQKLTSTNILSLTSNRLPPHQADSPTTSVDECDDEWWMWNGGEFE